MVQKNAVSQVSQSRGLAPVLVLGSGSPRRREILSALGVSYVVHAAHADESVRPGENVSAYLPRVALAKLDAVRQSIPEALRSGASAILVADTSVILGDRILGKPIDAADALAMIKMLAGCTHEVWTRFVLASMDGNVWHAESVVTQVTFRAIDDEEAQAYAQSGEGMDKAGGYAVQGRAAAFAKRIDGSYSNVVGLPACEVSVALRSRSLV